MKLVWTNSNLSQSYTIGHDEVAANVSRHSGWQMYKVSWWLAAGDGWRGEVRMVHSKGRVVTNVVTDVSDSPELFLTSLACLLPTFFVERVHSKYKCNVGHWMKDIINYKIRQHSKCVSNIIFRTDFMVSVITEKRELDINWSQNSF